LYSDQPLGVFVHDSFPPLDQPNQWDEIKAFFEQRHGIPNIIRAIDGTHIPVAMPCDNNWEGYINRKGWVSLTFQCVIDSEGNFCNVELPTQILCHIPYPY
jgi:hypothetical protein